MSRRILAATALALVVGLPFPAAAHDVPADVSVQAFLKPEGERLHLLLRAPLAALRDVAYPTRGPGYLDLGRVEASLREAATIWIAKEIEIYEDDVRLPEPRIVAVRVSLPSYRSFGTYADAVAHLQAPPLPDQTELHWIQGMLDVWLEYPIRSPRSRFSIRPRFERLGLRVVTALRLLTAEGPVRAFELAGDPGLVRLDPRWHQAALRFVGLGFLHILDGTDHLLFLLCLVVPFRRLRPLVLIVTAFTLAHSITLMAAAFGLAPGAAWFAPFVETAIAASIVYMALENVVAPHVGRRWVIAFAFGLVHGFGFSFGLQQTLQFAGSHLVTSLLAFNLGIELGQLLVLALLVPALELVFRVAVPERVGTIVVSALVAHTGWHWMIDRWERFRQFPLQWPVLNAALLAGVTRWLLAAVIVAGLGWLVFGALLRSFGRGAEGRAATGTEE